MVINSLLVVDETVSNSRCKRIAAKIVKYINDNPRLKVLYLSRNATETEAHKGAFLEIFAHGVKELEQRPSQENVYFLGEDKPVLCAENVQGHTVAKDVQGQVEICGFARNCCACNSAYELLEMYSDYQISLLLGFLKCTQVEGGCDGVLMSLMEEGVNLVD